MKEYYVLRIVDDEDDYHYKTLLFDNVDDYNLAQNVIRQYEKEFYEQEAHEMSNWYEGLIETLKKAALLGLQIKEASTIYVR
jgi:hypothetical protein